MALKAAAAAFAALTLLLLALPLVFAGGDIEASPAASACAVGTPAGGDTLTAVLATIRSQESGSDYTARAPGSTASGAYQFTDATWDSYGGYASASLAPAAVQDAKAAEHVTAILTANSGDIAAVPVTWYLGYIPAADDPAWGQVPAPGAGNRLTPRAYQAEWLEEYARRTGQGPSPAATVCEPQVPDVQPTEGGRLQLTTVEGITVNARIAPNLHQLVGAARAAGFDLEGSGYRSPAEQIELRRRHCGASRYAIYEMPSSQCSPPTARPGQSNHEQGLAIDVTCDDQTPTRASACFHWLADHAPALGLHNLPSEPWHWSVDGT